LIYLHSVSILTVLFSRNQFSIRSLYPQLNNVRWEPDFGPAKFLPDWGATMVGARKFLIAYNINLIATKEQAHR
jgi:glutamate formiminotransferase